MRFRGKKVADQNLEQLLVVLGVVLLQLLDELLMGQQLGELRREEERGSVGARTLSELGSQKST